MFPSARNSLRRDHPGEVLLSSSSSSTSTSRSKLLSKDADNNSKRILRNRIPIPVAVVLRNFISMDDVQRLNMGDRGTKICESNVSKRSNDDENDDVDCHESLLTSSNDDPARDDIKGYSNSNKWMHRPQYDMKLLPRLRLDITATIFPSEETTASIPSTAVTTTTTTTTTNTTTTDSGIATVVAFSETTTNQVVHPSWEHLDERIRFPISVIPPPPPSNDQTSITFSSSDEQQRWWDHNEVYKSMRAKLSIVVPDSSLEYDVETEDEVDHNEESMHEQQRKQPQQEQQQPQQRTIDFMDIPLHPSLLRRIDADVAGKNGSIIGDNNSNNKNDNSTGRDDNDDGAFDDEILSILPPNALLVYYSDGSIRCSPYLYQILVDARRIVTTNTVLVEDFSRFEDDVFKTLDGVETALTPQRRQRTASSLLDQDDDTNVVATIFQEQAPTDPTTSNFDGGADSVPAVPLSPPSRNTLATVSAFPVGVSQFAGSSSQSHRSPSLSRQTQQHQNKLRHSNNGNLVKNSSNNNSVDHLPMQYPVLTAATGEMQREENNVGTVSSSSNNNNSNNDTNNNNLRPSPNNDPFQLPDEDDVLQSDWVAEKEKLLGLIAQGEDALHRDWEALTGQTRLLQAYTQELHTVEEELVLVRKKVAYQRTELQRDEFMKDAQCIKLIRDLRPMYPISGASGTGEGYLIRGLRLPVDIYTTQVSEEEINASLGYCAHLTFMVAKYLTIQLRHRIFCNSSRSAIQQDGVGVFPLFLGRLAARSLEREQVDHGSRLLGQNVNCIMTHLQLPSSLQQTHILGRLKMILDFVADGITAGSNNNNVIITPGGMVKGSKTSDRPSAGLAVTNGVHGA